MKETWTLYTLGNGDAVALIFHGIQAIVYSPMFRGLMHLMVLLGFGWIVGSSVLQGRLMVTRMVKYLLMTVVLMHLVLSVHMRLGLVDLITPKNNQVITQVPWIIGIPAAVLSQMGYALAQQMDTAYAATGKLPAALSLTGGHAGTGVPQGVIGQMLTDAHNYRIQDPYLRNSLTHFFVDCVTPMISSGGLQSHELLSSHALWDLLKKERINPALMTLYYGSMAQGLHESKGVVDTCSHVYLRLTEDLKRIRATHFPGWSRRFQANTATALFQTILSSMISQKNYTPTPGDYIQQAALVNLLSGPVLMHMSQQSNTGNLIQAVAVAQAQQATHAHWGMSQSLFQVTFGYIYAALHVMVYAMGPVVCIFALLPGMRAVMLQRYVQLLAWFPLTFVLLSVVNNSMTLWSQTLLSEAWSHGGLSLQGKSMVRDSVAQFIAVGGWLTTCVPLMAWGLLTGLQSGMGAILNATQAHWFSRGGAMESVTGNVHLDDQSYHTTHANTFNSAWNTDLGAVPTRIHTSGTGVSHQAHMGGLSIFEQGQFSMQTTTQTTETGQSQTQESSTQKEQSLRHQDSESKHLSREQAYEQMHTLGSNLSANITGNRVAALSALAMQQYLGHHHLSLPKATLDHLAAHLQKAGPDSGPEATLKALKAAAEPLASETRIPTEIKSGLLGVGAVAAMVGASALLPEAAMAEAGTGLVAGGRVLLEGVKHLFKGVSLGAAESLVADTAMNEALKSQGINLNQLGVTAGIFSAIGQGSHGQWERIYTDVDAHIQKIEQGQLQEKVQQSIQQIAQAHTQKTVREQSQHWKKERTDSVPYDSYYQALETEELES